MYFTLFFLTLPAPFIIWNGTRSWRWWLKANSLKKNFFLKKKKFNKSYWVGRGMIGWSQSMRGRSITTTPHHTSWTISEQNTCIQCMGQAGGVWQLTSGWLQQQLAMQCTTPSSSMPCTGHDDMPKPFTCGGNFKFQVWWWLISHGQVWFFCFYNDRFADLFNVFAFPSLSVLYSAPITLILTPRKITYAWL